MARQNGTTRESAGLIRLGFDLMRPDFDGPPSKQCQFLLTLQLENRKISSKGEIKMAIKDRIKLYVGERPHENAFLRKEFSSLGSRTAVTDAIRELIGDGFFVRGGTGVLVKAKYNDIIKDFAPVVSPDQFSKEVLIKIGVDPQPNSALIEYNSGKSTQIPAWLCYRVDRRIVRKIGFKKRWVQYEYVKKSR
ncbi:MAG: hypothetical protein D084_Lepto4C00430G0002 [Leptospirillum sp. Group IV 'UBA BS']|nr:MAG: hypothetical protein D084_Lepto4C00430G0002 [Leptospirillum sp. Group IV 'UBA BS']